MAAIAAPTITASGTGTVLAPLPVIPTGAGSQANGVAATDTHLYVADGPHDQILVYSLDGVAQSTIALSAGDYPLDIALSPDKSTLYVADLSSARISKIDLASSAATSFAAVAGHDIAVSPDGTVVYLLEDGDSQVHAFSTVSGSAVATSVTNGIYQTPSSLAVSPDGATIYASYRDPMGVHTTGGVRLLHASDLSEITSDDFQNAGALAVDPTGNVFVGTNDGTSGGGSIQELTSFGVPIGTPLSTGNVPSVAVVSPDGATVYVGDDNGSQLYAVDIAAHTVSGALGPVGEAESMAVSPDGVHLYSSSGTAIPGSVFPFSFLKLTLTAPASVTPGTGATAFDTQIDDGTSPVGDHSGDSLLIEIVDATNTVVASGSGAPGATTGAASIPVNLATLPVGTYSVRAALTGPDGTIIVTAAGFTIAAAGSAALAATGVDALLPAGIAVLLLLAGAITVLARRRVAVRA